VKIVVIEDDFFQFLGQVQQGIADLEFVQHLVAHGFNDLGTRVVGLVNPVAEAHEPERVLAVLGAFDVMLHAGAAGGDILKHFDHGLIGAAMQGPQRAAMPAEMAA
jgi:hypothetical protein